MRVRTVAGKGYLTVKGLAEGIARAEFEYEIPLDDANELLDGLCRRPLIEKERRKIGHGDAVWEVDEFFGDNAGLIVAEVELENEDQVVEIPEWVGREVTGERRYFNASLITNPYRSWSD